MSRTVFRENIFISFIVFIVMVVLAIILYVKLELPIIVVPIVILIAFSIFIPAIRKKVVIEDGTLRYEKIGKTESVALQEVSQIVRKEQLTYVDKHISSHDNEKNSGNIKLGKTGFKQANPKEKNMKKFVSFWMMREEQYCPFPQI